MKVVKLVTNLTPKSLYMKKLFYLLIAVTLFASCGPKAKINSRRLILANTYRIIASTDSNGTWVDWPNSVSNATSIIFHEPGKAKDQYGAGDFDISGLISGSFQYTCPEHGRLEIVNTDTSSSFFKTGTYNYDPPLFDSSIIIYFTNESIKFHPK